MSEWRTMMIKTPEEKLKPNDFFKHPPKLIDISEDYDWNKQVKFDEVSGEIYAYRLTTQTFDTTGHAKDSDKD